MFPPQQRCDQVTTQKKEDGDAKPAWNVLYAHVREKDDEYGNCPDPIQRRNVKLARFGRHLISLLSGRMVDGSNLESGWERPDVLHKSGLEVAVEGSNLKRHCSFGPSKTKLNYRSQPKFRQLSQTFIGHERKKPQIGLRLFNGKDKAGGELTALAAGA